MKKLGIATLATVLIAAAAALAAGQVNAYSVTAATSPTKSGTKHKPVPIALSFDYTVGEKSGLRPSPVKQYKVTFGGLLVTQTGVPACTATQLNSAQTDAGCPKGSQVGQGTVYDTVGPTNDPTSQTSKCTLPVKVYNSGGGHAALWLTGSCVGTAVHNAIDAQYVQTATKSTLQWTVPPILLHPIPGLDIAVTRVQSTINRRSVGTGAKKTGYYASVGGCKAHKRAVSVTFVSEAGQSSVATTTAKCS
jgi:hypothetical protein